MYKLDLFGLILDLKSLYLRNWISTDMETPFLCKIACNAICGWYKFDRDLSTTWKNWENKASASLYVLLSNIKPLLQQ